ncbi:MAG: hypothetical protein DRJ06_04660 [Candidatus Aminicenantes bacterium]|nr:MAG: hypothetical protein DRJ06_04660 [Candidatus Aminicenantes bacterium]
MLDEHKEMRPKTYFFLIFSLVRGKMVTGTILAGSLGNVPGQNKVPVTILPSRFWRHIRKGPISTAGLPLFLTNWKIYS